MNLKTVKISEIKTNPNNPRLIKDEKFKKLVKSINEFPEMLEIRPIVVNADMIVLGGNMRLKACKEAGLKEIQIIFANDLTEEQQREFIIKDNVGFGEWDWELIANEWDAEELDDWGLDVPDFGTEVLDAEEDDFDTTPPEIPITVLGDLYEIGEHRLLCGDSTDSDQVAKLMNGGKADMVFTDPMYQDSPLQIISIFNIIETNHFLIMATFKQCISFITDSGFRFRFDLVLNQKVPSSSMNKKVPYYLHKNIVYLTKNDETIFHCDNAIGYFSEKGYYPSVIESAKNTSETHGLTKNAEGIKLILSGFKFNSVLDLFIGSGSTMVAAHQLKRKCYGMELDPKYCDVIVNRMRNLDPSLVIKRNGIQI
jgi:16S rRNA G966 N2-methylase RsmD